MENIVRKGEIACSKQFLLFLQCFLPYMALIFHFKCTLKNCLQFVLIWTSLKLLSSSNGIIGIRSWSQFTEISQSYCPLLEFVQVNPAL